MLYLNSRTTSQIKHASSQANLNDILDDGDILNDEGGIVDDIVDGADHADDGRGRTRTATHDGKFVCLP